MKFLCDRCKTRYSIGDDRVRGKILKIRCKNCANVITVREGMPDADAADPGGVNRPRTSTQANPIITSSAPAPAAAPAAPKLEDEWYVSIDGVQSGPFSLPDAQKWVAAKALEADLHCWCEGFDDWLPVDKVSHFRNLRKPQPVKPVMTPPPIPKAEKPLFAATMASIEKAASSGAMPAAKASSSGPMPAASTPAPVQAKSNGSPAAAKPAFPKFDEVPDSRTTVGSPAFEAESPDPFFSAKSSPKMPAVGAKPEPKPAVTPIHNDEGDDLEIGEVSRVVNLADLMRSQKPTGTKTPTASFDRTSGTGSVPRVGGTTGSIPRIGGGTASNPRVTSSIAKMTPAELGMNVDSSLATPSGEPHADESIVARSFAQRHRRGLMLLIGVSGVMVVGVVLLFMFVVNDQRHQFGSGLGGTRQIDTSRPEDIVRKQLPHVPSAGSNAVVTQKPRWRPSGGNTTTNPIEEPAGGSTLRASEVEDMAAKQGEGTKRCYMRAQKGALGFEIAEVKKIAVTLTVNKDGSVGTVDLSSHANNTFGQCLIARIKGWRFRESSGGTFRISLAFSNG